MSFIKQHTRLALVTGLVFLTIVVVALMASPQDFLTDVYFIDTELSENSESRIAVDVKWDLSREQALNQFPYQIGEWNGSDEDTMGLKESLGATTVIKRAYTRGGEFKPVYLLLMQSESLASFHPPTVCYPAIGYDIKEESKDIVQVSDISWLDTDPFKAVPVWAKGNPDLEIETGKISVKKLIVENESNRDRRVVLYFYVKESNVSSNTISMLRISSPVSHLHTDEDALILCKTLMSEVIPRLFDPGQTDNEILYSYLSRMGLAGYVFITILVCVPLAIVAVPLIIEFRKHRPSLPANCKNPEHISLSCQ